MDQFIQAFTQKLMMYALGRELEYFDMPQVRDIVRAAEAVGGSPGVRVPSHIADAVEGERLRELDPVQQRARVHPISAQLGPSVRLVARITVWPIDSGWTAWGRPIGTT